MKRIGTICLALAVLSAICLSFAACPSPTSSAPAYKPAAADVVTAMGSATPIQTATGSPLSTAISNYTTAGSPIWPHTFLVATGISVTVTDPTVYPCSYTITVTNLSSGGYTINGTVVMTWPSVSAMSVAENLTFTGGNLTSSITVIASGSISGSPTFNNMTVNGYAWDYANNVYK